MLTEENIVPSDLFYALNDVHRLTETVRNLVQELDFIRQDGTRIDGLDTISSLINIADERIEQLAEACLRFDTGAFDKPNNDTMSKPIRLALKAFEEKEAIYRPLAKALVEDDALEAASEAMQQAEDALIRTPCLTLADVRAKATLAINNESTFDSITNCRNKHEHVGKTFLKSILGQETKL